MAEEIKVLYQSRAVKVIEKPTGVLSTDVSKLICHRLDRDTSGCMIIAKDRETKKKIQDQFRERRVKKIYQALVLGRLREKKKIVEGWLERDSKNPSKMRLDKAFLKSGDEYSEIERVGEKKKRYSKTIIRLVKVSERNLFTNPSQKESDYLSLIEAQPITGRRHQIRVHLSSLQHPILGDSFYGSKISKRVSERLGIKRLMLHAKEILFTDSSNNKRVMVESELPKEFEEYG